MEGGYFIQTSRIHFIHTNDLHSQFEHWPQTVSTIQSLIKKIEEENEEYLLVDIGDHVDRSHLITEGTMGQANVDLLNQVGYHYVTIGNNEGITFSKDKLDRLYKDATFEVILSNLWERDQTYPKWLKPYVIHQCGDVKIGLIGGTANFNLFYELLGWRMTNPMESIIKWVKLLRDQVDFIVVLSHLGLPKDKLLAQNVQGIDLILGAHTHHLLPEGLKVGNTWINQAGRGGQNVGYISVEWTNKDDMPTQCTATCLHVQNQPPDRTTKTLLRNWQAIAEQNLEEQVISLEQDIHISWYEESMFGNLLAEGLRDWCKTPISLVNSGQLLEHFTYGKVTKGDLLRVCPHPINPCIVTLSGKEIHNILQRSLDPELQRMIIKGLGFRGEVLGMLSIDGIEVSYKDISSTEKEIVSIKKGRQSLQPNELYDVATIDMFTFCTIFPELHQPKKIRYILPEFLRDVLAYRFEQGNFERAQCLRWKKI